MSSSPFVDCTSPPDEQELKALKWLKSVGIRRQIVSSSFFIPSSLPSSDPPVSSTPTNPDAFAASFFPFNPTPLTLSSCTSCPLDSSHTLPSSFSFPPSSPPLPSFPLPFHLLCADSQSTTERFPGDLTGLHVWPISAFLCSFLSTHLSLLHHRHVLELGSGTGLVGLFAASHATALVLSDVNDNACVMCKHNIQLNGMQRQVRVIRLPWGDDEPSLISAIRPSGGFCTIIGSDCIYKLSSLDVLFETIDLLLSPPSSPSSSPPVFVHAYQPRFDAVNQHLLTVARRYHFTLFIALPPPSTSSLSLYGVQVKKVETADDLPLTASIQMFVRDSSYK